MIAGPNRLLAVFVSVIVVLAVVAGVVASRRTSPVLDRATPEGVTQAYVQAVLAGDMAGAADLLAPASGCDITDTGQAYLPDSVRVVLESTTVDGSKAVVTLRVTDSYGDEPFGDGGYTHTERVTLEKDGGRWRVLASPWLLPMCVGAKG
ncbi:MAG TPA: hypothetical protein VGK35_04150 [Actinotalea sp.]